MTLGRLHASAGRIAVQSCSLAIIIRHHHTAGSAMNAVAGDFAEKGWWDQIMDELVSTCGSGGRSVSHRSKEGKRGRGEMQEKQ